MSDLTIRHLTSADEQVLCLATLGNVNWAEDRFTMRDVVDRPELAHYTRLDPARGDFGFAAERSDRTVGAVWAVFLPAQDAGYGFVDDHTPELSLWVAADERGHGVGRRLLRLLKEEACRHGVRALSLSVEADNLARHLYEAEGFRAVEGREADGVMLWSSGHD
jgi:GNAT superfamily N-acetyltransferase